MPPGSKKTPRVSIIIRALNEEKHLGRLLSAIQRQSLPDPEVILVDSGSTDRTLAIARQYKATIVHIKPQDFTFGRSLNLGIRKASGDVMVLASAHVFPENDDWLKHLVAPFTDPQVAMTYGKQRGTDESQFSESQHFRKWFPETSALAQPHGFANNANSAVRKSVWQTMPFDEELTGLEDLAWASWAHAEGYTIAYVAEAGVYHVHTETAAQIMNRHRREAIALRQILPESTFSFFNFLSLLVRTTLSDYAAALRQGQFLHQLINIPRFRFLQYWGTYRGYRDPAQPSSQLKRVFYYPPDSLEPRPAPPGRRKARNKSA
ncbi:MAG: glycosyltransferase family 2 protein [Anaerolineales bacterium]|nr:MAG: glycosyltransferase family 2 protein [Anaerolineales bacterium]